MTRLRRGLAAFGVWIGAITIAVPGRAYGSDGLPESSSAPVTATAPTAKPAPQGDGTGAPPSASGADSEEQLLFALENKMTLMVSTTASTKTEAAELPSIVTVFTREDIDQLGVHRLSDLLSYVPGFYEVAGQLGRNFAIRGVHASTAEHFVVLIDGVPAHDFLTSDSSPDTFDLDYADRVEIIRGPASFVFGANALMGAVNIVTREGSSDPHLSSRFTMGSDLGVRQTLTLGRDFGSAGSLYAAGTFFMSNGTRFIEPATHDVLIPNQGQNIYDGLQQGENLTAPRANTPVVVNRYGPSFDLFLKYKHQKEMVQFNFARTDFFPQRTAGQALIDAAHEQQQPEYITQRLMATVEKRWGAQTDRLGELTLRASGLYYTHDMRSQIIGTDFYDLAAQQNQSVLTRWSGSDLLLKPVLQYSVRLPDFHFLRENYIFAGVDGQYSMAFDYSLTRCHSDINQQFTSPGLYAGNGPRLYCLAQTMVDQGLLIDSAGNVSITKKRYAGNGDEWRVGGFLQLSTRLFKTVGLVFTGRVDYHPDFGPRFSPRVAVVTPIAWGFYAKALFSQAFVYPAFLYRNGNALSEYVGNQDIKPQSINTFEFLLGLRKRLFRVDLNFYYNQVHDFITFDLDRNAQTGTYRFSNQGNLNILGLEATAVASLWRERISLTFGGSFAKPVAGTSSQLIYNGELGGPSKYPQFKTSLIVNVKPIKMLNINVSGIYSSAVVARIPQETQYQNLQGTDGGTYSSQPADQYPTQSFVLNAFVSVEPRKWVMLGIGGSNIVGTTAYRPGSVLVPYLMPGRVIYGTVGFRY